MIPTILILGAGGQIGSELTEKLRTIYGSNHVIASDIRNNNTQLMNSASKSLEFKYDFFVGGVRYCKRKTH